MHDNAKLSSLSKVEVGQTILVEANQQAPRLFGRPKSKTAIPLRVKAKTFEPDQWSGKVWTLTLNDDTKTEPRYGTTHVYVVESARRVEPAPGGAKINGTLPAGAVGEHTTPKGTRVRITEDKRVQVLTDEQANARNTAAPVDEDALNGARCDRCKGYGLVRKRGSRAGRHYKTLAGAQAALGNGNAEDCGGCKGTGLVAKRAA